MPDTFITFMLFAIVATLSPGGATTLATASGVRFGYRRSVPMMLGIAAGLAILSTAGATGLGAIMSSFPALQLAIKVAGTLYLTWLAWQIWGAVRPQGPAGDNQNPIAFLSGGALHSQILTTDLQWRLVNRILAVLLVASIAPLWVR